MANIMLTDACNLRCPYCFANEFVNKDRNEITEENFDKAVAFILGDGTRSSLGLIGGEPTTHPMFEQFLRKLILNEKAKSIVVYTNGICLDRFFDLLAHPKVHLLINCNSPTDIGENPFRIMCDNIDALLDKRLCKDRVTLGINMYKPDFEYGYILDLLKKYKLPKVRVSITVPNMDDNRNTDAHAYFLKMKPRVYEFFHELMKNRIVPSFDCNKLPSCLVTTEELQSFRPYYKDPELREWLLKSNISKQRVACQPVIDIRQDLTAVRCFGLSQYTKQSITDFKSIGELTAFYANSIDVFAFNTAYSAKCQDCSSRKTMQCMGGCLAFKISDILKVRKFAEAQMTEK